MSTLKARFDAESGRRRLVEALKSQRIVEFDEALAARLAEVGELVEFLIGAELVHQGDTDNDVFFLIEGRALVEVNGRIIAERTAGDCVGEMAAIDPTVRRSATVRAQEPTLALRVSEPNFQVAIEQSPNLWKRLALVLAERLRQREQFHRVPNAVPILFVGSSVEGLVVANEIVEGLKHDNVVPKQWSSPGVFSPGGVTIDSLLAEVDRADFALMVFGPDDQVASRNVSQAAPRDNVVFELGLFMGRLDRSRAFIVRDANSEIKVPSDLLGLTPLSYVVKAGADMAGTLAPVCNALRKKIKEMGPR